MKKLIMKIFNRKGYDEYYADDEIVNALYILYKYLCIVYRDEGYSATNIKEAMSASSCFFEKFLKEGIENEKKSDVGQ